MMSTIYKKKEATVILNTYRPPLIESAPVMTSLLELYSKSIGSESALNGGSGGDPLTGITTSTVVLIIEICIIKFGLLQLLVHFVVKGAQVRMIVKKYKRRTRLEPESGPTPRRCRRELRRNDPRYPAETHL